MKNFTFNDKFQLRININGTKNKVNDGNFVNHIRKIIFFLL